MLQKKAIRIITHSDYLSHTAPLFRENGILTSYNIYYILLGQFMYKYFHNVLPSNFDNFFHLNSDHHHYLTSHSTDVHFGSMNTNAGQRSIKHKRPHAVLE